MNPTAPKCKRCGSSNVISKGKEWKCNGCGRWWTKKPVKRNCIICGKEFLVKNRSGRAKTCSEKCSKKKERQYRKDWHGKNRDYIRKKNKEWYRKNKERKLKYNLERRRKIKGKRVKELGGKCARCGYDEFIEVLEFHHIDPTKKETVYDYIRKDWNPKNYVLLCSNCHQAFHYGKIKEISTEYWGGRK